MSKTIPGILLERFPKGVINPNIFIFIIMEKQNEPNQLNIELSEEVAQGIYSNLAVISHSSSEFIVDFIRLMPGIPKAKVQSRIILTPEHAKRLLSALQENIAKFESQFGKINKPVGNGNTFMPPIIGFGGGEA